MEMDLKYKINVTLVTSATHHQINLIWSNPPDDSDHYYEPDDNASWWIPGVHSRIDGTDVCWWYNPNWHPGGVVYYTFPD